MIAVGMAEDKPVDAPGVDAEQVEIAVDDFRRIAEIENILRVGGGADGFEVERQPPLAGEGGHLPPRYLPDMLDGDEGMGDGGQETLIDGIDDHADR